MSEIAIVGGGPSGAMCGEQLARAGNTVHIFDEHLAWEKPCGGGLTYKATQCFPFLLDNHHPKKLIRDIEIISAENQRVKLDLQHPIVIYSRTVLNGLLLDRARDAGCHVHRFARPEGGDRPPISRGIPSMANGARRFRGPGGRRTQPVPARHLRALQG